MVRCWVVLLGLMSFRSLLHGYPNKPFFCNTPDWPYSCNCFDEDGYAGDCECKSDEWPHSCACYGDHGWAVDCKCNSAEWPRSCGCDDEQGVYAGDCASTCGLPCGEVWLGDGDVWAYATPDYITGKRSPGWAWCLCEWIVHAPVGKNLSLALDQSGFVGNGYFFVSERGGGLDQPLSVCGDEGDWPASLCDGVVASGSLHIGLHASSPGATPSHSTSRVTTDDPASEPLNATVLHDLPDNAKDMMDCQCSDKDILLIVEQSASIKSPGFPNQYPNFCNCYWTVHAPPECKVSVVANEFSLSVFNLGDYLAAYDVVDDPPRTSLRDLASCSGDSCESFNSTSNRLALVFVSDDYTTDKGFFLTITTADCTACDVTPCQHGGTCTPDGADVHCHCLPGYNGHLCQNIPPDCQTLYCDNGGTCIKPSFGEVKCVCAAGFTGQMCDELITTPGSSISTSSTTTTTTSEPATTATTLPEALSTSAARTSLQPFSAANTTNTRTMSTTGHGVSSTASAEHDSKNLVCSALSTASQPSSTHSAGSSSNVFSSTVAPPTASESASTRYSTSTSTTTKPAATESGTSKSTILVVWLSCAAGGLLVIISVFLAVFCTHKRCTRPRKTAPEIQIFSLPPPPTIPLPSIPSTPESSRREQETSLGSDSGYAGIRDSTSVGSGIYETCDYATIDESAAAKSYESTADHEEGGLPNGSSEATIRNPPQPKDGGYESASVVPAAYTESSSAPYSMASTVGGTEGDTGLGSELQSETEYGYATMDAANALPMVKLGALPPPPNRPIPPTPMSVRSDGPKPGYADCISLKLGTPSEFADYLARRSVVTPTDVYSSLSDVSTLGAYSTSSFGTQCGDTTEGTDAYAMTMDGNDSDGTLQEDEGEYNVSRF